MASVSVGSKKVRSRPVTSGSRRVPPAEGHVVVAVEDPHDGLEVEGRRRDPGQLGAVLHEPLLPEEPDVDVRVVDEGPVVLVELVEVAPAEAHAAELRLEAPGDGHERQVGLGELDVERAGPVLLELVTGLDPHLGARIGVDLAEEAHLDLPGEDAVLLALKRAGPRLLDPLRGEAAREVPGHPHVEEELAGAPPLVQRERLPRAGQVQGRDLGGRARSRRRRAGGDRGRRGRRAGRR